MAPNGVLACNFAGSLSAAHTRSIALTLLGEFAHCRALADEPVAGRHDSLLDASAKPVNLVFICSKDGPVRFRSPRHADELPEGPSPLLRRQILSQFAEHEVPPNVLERMVAMAPGERPRILEDGHTAWFDEDQRKLAYEHWHVMQSILPVEAWALY